MVWTKSIVGCAPIDLFYASKHSNKRVGCQPTMSQNQSGNIRVTKSHPDNALIRTRLASSWRLSRSSCRLVDVHIMGDFKLLPPPYGWYFELLEACQRIASWAFEGDKNELSHRSKLSGSVMQAVGSFFTWKSFECLLSIEPFSNRVWEFAVTPTLWSR